LNGCGHCGLAMARWGRQRDQRAPPGRYAVDQFSVGLKSSRNFRAV
jgi:hypothetical protein